MRFGNKSKRDYSGRRTKRTIRGCDGAMNDYKTYTNPEQEYVMYPRWSSKGRLDGYHRTKDTDKKSKKKVVYQNIKYDIDNFDNKISEYDCLMMIREDFNTQMSDLDMEWKRSKISNSFEIKTASNILQSLMSEYKQVIEDN